MKRAFIQRSSDQIDKEKTECASEETTSTPEPVNNLSTDDGTDWNVLARQ